MWELFQQRWPWPLVFICAGMIVAAVIDGWKLKVPNWLTFPLIVSGWLLGIYYQLTEHAYVDDNSNRILASLLGTALGFALLAPLWIVGGMGAGDVKMLMGFGSWVGAYFGIHYGLWIVFYCFCLGAIIGGILAVPMMLFRFQTHMANAREILKDLAGGIGHAGDKAAQRKSRMRLLPYGVPLCLGILTYLSLRGFDMLPAFLTP
jgi:prepilin peptidase CpaA